MTLHPIVEAAAAGELPDWAEATPKRRGHMARVAALLGSWAEALHLPDEEAVRWRALGHLHDSMRSADHEALRPWVPPEFRALHGSLLHGPAAAERLRVDGVQDGGLLRAVAYHTLGHPDLGPEGRALYAADFLEPGRDLRNEWRADLRDHLPGDMNLVVREVLAARIAYLVENGRPIRPETAAFWNHLAEERS